MWEIKKNNQANVIMELEFEEFSHVIVTKNDKKPIKEYQIEVEIFDIYETTFSTFTLKDVEEKMKIIKKQIEELYEDIPLFDTLEIEHWISEFEDELSF